MGPVWVSELCRLPAQHSELLLGSLVTVHEAVQSAVSSNTAPLRSRAVSILLQGGMTRHHHRHKRSQATITATSAAPPAPAAPSTLLALSVSTWGHTRPTAWSPSSLQTESLS